jgi:hypothetical protein
MATAAQFRTEHLAQKPAGYRVRTVKRGSHEIRIGFPPGRRHKGSGKVLEILHPKSEKNSSCIVSQRAKSNPMELLIFGNPSSTAAKRATRDRAARIRSARLNGHKANCKCFACKHARGENPKKRIAKRATPSRRRRDRNPDETEQAVRLFEAFHGKEPRGIVEKQVSATVRKDYSACGPLLQLTTITPAGDKVEWDFTDDKVMLAAAPPPPGQKKSRQLYCIGGNQDVSRSLDASSLQKDFIDLGECTRVIYFAQKSINNFEPTEWDHKFGEQNGVKPQLMFDKLKKQLFFIGGDYFIDIGNGLSPGIEN